MPREGERVGRYEVVREIGRGGMAAVFLARQTDLDRDVALKQLGAFHATDPAAAARFLQESRITGSLGHPNIVTVHEYLQHEGTPYIAMEYLERGSLRPYVRGLGLAQVAGVLEGVLAALAHAADQGIVHRDLKPENLMLTRAGTVKVADFGIAKAVNEVQTSYATATGTTVGTPAYMSPEQAMAKGVGPSTDLYAVGVMGYEMLVGRVPYTADTPIAVLLQHVNEPVPRPLEVAPGLDPELAGWLGSMLAKSPADRPSDAAEAWDRLEGIVIRLLGPRWRRDARLLEGSAAAVARPLTPAPFDSVQSPATPAPETRPPEPPAPAQGTPPPSPAPTGFETFARGAEPPAPAPQAPQPAPPPAPAPTGFETFARPGAAPAPPAAEGAVPPPAADPAAPPIPAPDAVDDGFRTFDPQPRPAAPAAAPGPPAAAAPPPPTPAPPTATSEPEPVPDPGATPPELEATVPPQSRTPVPATAPPPAADDAPGAAEAGGGGGRRGLLLGGAAAVAAAVVVGVLLIAGGGGGDDEAPPAPPADTTAVVPDLLLDDAPVLAAGGGALFVADPAGRVVRLADGRRTASLGDPSSPAAVAAGGGRVVTAGGDTVTTLRARDLRPLAAVAFAGASSLASGGGRTAVAGATRADRGRVCAVDGATLGPCATLDFAPTGVGAAAGVIAVADGEAGQVVLLRTSGDALVPDAPIPVGAAPHGRIVEDRGRVYVAVERGVAAVDLTAGQAVGTFATPTTPADLAVVATTGVLAAALPGSGAVALIDTTETSAAPRLVEVGGTPAALAATAAGVQVLTTEGAVAAVDPAAGTSAAATPVDGFGAEPPPAATLERITSSVAGRRVTLTLDLGAGVLPEFGLRIPDRAIGDGRGSVELWQGGIASAVERRTVAGVRVSVTPRAGRLVVALAADAKRFQSMATRLAGGGSSVAIVLLERPPAPEPEPEPRAPSPSPTPRPAPTPAPVPTPAPAPTPAPDFETG